MIKIENIYTGNWEATIRGMRNPMNSWDKSDSYWKECDGDCCMCSKVTECQTSLGYDYILGPNDLKLAKHLVKAGTDHSKFMRMIIFSCDITAPLYWWKEMDTYKVGTVRNSCSTMHKIMSKEFEKEDFSNEHGGLVFEKTLEFLNDIRKVYLSDGLDKENKGELFRLVIENLPSSYNQKATWAANYAVLRNIYHSRKNHKLQEWHDFCHMIERLPYSELITE